MPTSESGDVTMTASFASLSARLKIDQTSRAAAPQMLELREKKLGGASVNFHIKLGVNTYTNFATLKIKLMGYSTISLGEAVARIPTTRLWNGIAWARYIDSRRQHKIVSDFNQWRTLSTGSAKVAHSFALPFQAVHDIDPIETHSHAFLGAIRTLLRTDGTIAEHATKQGSMVYKALLHISELSNLVSRVFVNIYKLGANAYVPPAEPRQNYTTMKFTIVFAALALATGAAAQVDRQDAMRNLARSLIAEYEDFLEERAGGCQARSPQGTSGMECDPYNCDKYCVMGDKKCKWSERPKNCKKCTCTKA
ncbi:hypothetical protein BKA70DRAFT_1395932 [Coprinopsis sp. MPI-PUGE-AT-0042]|nr:hypothetical protein BKA70DRAFT_1395932 [Coprinopsis sp. MPI-PUGE-AT-0042]